MFQDLLHHLQESPDAVLAINYFQEYLKTETQKRQEFYDLVHENIKAEFIQGEIVLHSPVKMKHWKINSRVSTKLNNFVDNHDLGIVGSEKVMIHLTRNSYEPDIVFFRKEISQTFKEDEMLFPAPDLVVEILSDSTRTRDYGIKFRDYEAHGVGEYWIIDADAQTLEQYVLHENKFILQHKFEQKGTLVSLVINGFRLEIEKIFQ
jgi:Uma2 family endonuclease